MYTSKRNLLVNFWSLTQHPLTMQILSMDFARLLVISSKYLQKEHRSTLSYIQNILFHQCSLLACLSLHFCWPEKELILAWRVQLRCHIRSCKFHFEYIYNKPYAVKNWKLSMHLISVFDRKCFRRGYRKKNEPLQNFPVSRFYILYFPDIF